MSAPDGSPTGSRPASQHRVGDEAELAIDKLVAGGDGLGRLDGRPVFVARSAPGDRLRVRIVEDKPAYARAEILDLLEPGPGRRTPPCHHFGRCGGCDLQHLEDDRQLELKVEATIETLARMSRVTLPPPDVVGGAPWGYRRRTQLHTRGSGTNVEVGYHERRSHRIVAVRECPVLVPELEIEVRRLPALLEGDPPRRLDLAIGDDGSLACAPVVPGFPRGELTTRVGEFDYGFDAGCFIQGHLGLTKRLVTTVVGDFDGDLAADLYAGVGLFSLPLARRYSKVVAVEGQRSAARFARKNAGRNRLANVEVVHQAVESWVTRWPRGCDRVVVDPPRSGLSKSTIHRLLDGRPSRLTYVSCHPAALARDLTRLAGVYEVEALTLLDLFPQTGHIEVVAQLRADPTS